MTHVINYDFPLNPSDYIHRAGRVGRVGGAKVKHVLQTLLVGFRVKRRGGVPAWMDPALGFSTVSFILFRGAG